MERGATANLIFEFEREMRREDVAAIRLYALGARSGAKVTKTEEDMVFGEGGRILVRFAQEETLGFADNEDVRFQWHWRDADGEVFVSAVEELCVYEFLGGGAI